MDIINILLTLISAIVVLFAIVFEGKLKVENKDKISINDFFKEILKISIFGWILIILMLLLNAGNSFISFKKEKSSSEQYVSDTIRFKTIIDELKSKRHNDSITIKKLENEVRLNGIKSDAIKIQLIDNAIKELDEQRHAIEKDRENVFIHMKNEIEDDLRKIYINYEKKHILGFADTSLFISTRLTNKYIDRYQTFSTSPAIIDLLMETSESIATVNKYAELCLSDDGKTASKRTGINMFLKNVEATENYLISIYGRIYNLDSYKAYESIDFSKDQKKINQQMLKLLLKLDYYEKNKALSK